MNIPLRQNIDLSQYTTMQVGGEAAFFAHVKTTRDLFDLVDYVKSEGSRLAVIGEGSNALFTDEGFDGVVVRMASEDYEFDHVDGEVIVHAQAGVNWDKLVELSVLQGLTGIEALSHIPGSVGAAPVQNIGAYGQEISNTLKGVEVYDTKEDQLLFFNNAECEFSYRDSIFKRNPGRYIITTVMLSLKHGQIQGQLYDALDSYLSAREIKDKSPQTIRDALYQIRWSKLPKPEELPNTGSFFKSPVVDERELKRLLQDYPDAPSYPMKDGQFKIPAGWLIEQLGLKGECLGPICIYEKHSLVLTNPEAAATFGDLMKAKEAIVEAVQDEFGLTLEQEPIIIE